MLFEDEESSHQKPRLGVMAAAPRAPGSALPALHPQPALPAPWGGLCVLVRGRLGPAETRLWVCSWFCGSPR